MGKGNMGEKRVIFEFGFVFCTLKNPQVNIRIRFCWIFTEETILGKTGGELYRRVGFFEMLVTKLCSATPKTPKLVFLAHSDKYLSKRAYWAAWREGIMGG